MKYVKKALLGGYTELSGREPGACLLFSEEELKTYLEAYHRRQTSEDIRQHTSARIQAEEKYDKLKAQSESEIQECKEELEAARSAIWEWKEYTEQLKADAEEKQAHLIQIIEKNENLYGNLRRINRERANAKRGLRPKKRHSGYVIQSSTEKLISHPFFRTKEPEMIWETVLQTPYSVELPAESARELIHQELFGETGGLAGALGIQDFYKAGMKKKSDSNLNVLLSMFLRVNYNQDFWEVILRHTGDPTKAPEEFLKPRKKEEEIQVF